MRLRMTWNGQYQADNQTHTIDQRFLWVKISESEIADEPIGDMLRYVSDRLARDPVSTGRLPCQQ